MQLVNLPSEDWLSILMRTLKSSFRSMWTWKKIQFILQYAIEKTTMGIFLIKHTADNEAHDVGIVLEGVAVLQDLNSVDFATSMLFGLIYALNLQYPTKLRFTYEIYQKLFIDLDAGELSIKAQFQI